MSDRTMSTFTRRNQVATLDAVRDLTGGGFDPDAWHVMNERDNQLIADELINGALSNKFVYSFNISGSGVVAGISVIGARHLASAYGGIKHRIVGSVAKMGTLFTFKSYPSPGMPMTMDAKRLPELGTEPDFYEVIVEVEDIKRGNLVQMERRELRFERRSGEALRKNPNLDEYFERPHYATIAQAKAYRNGVLAMIPQDFQLQWKAEALKLGKDDVLVNSLIAEKRSGVIQFAASKAVQIDRRALEELTMAQIGGLSEAARTKDLEQFRSAAEALGIVPGANGERTVVSLASTAAPTEKVGAKSEGAAPKSAAETNAPARREEEAAVARAEAAAKASGEPSNDRRDATTERQPATREEAWAGVETDQAGATQDQEGTRFEARVLDFIGEPTDRGAVIFDPVLYARKLVAYVAKLSPENRAQAIDWNGSYIEAAAGASEEASKALTEGLAALDAAPVTTTTATDAPPTGNLVVALEGAKYSKLVADCAADLDARPDAELDDWLAANRAHWEKIMVPPNTRAAIEGKFVARKARGSTPGPTEEETAQDVERARQDSFALTLRQEIDRVKNAKECREMESALRDDTSALGRMFVALAARADLVASLRTAFEDKAAEVGYTRGN